ncbi:MAG: DMT family transporter [Desulfurococcales archaeon]|nr:DMT family transporter [Desulfurococcales archaeon]
MDRERELWLYLLIVFAVVNVSTASILVRLAGVHGFVAATWRLIIGSALTLVLAILSGQIPHSWDRTELLLASASGVALALHFGLWMMSLKHLPVGISVTIVDSYPALLAIVGSRLFNETYTGVQLVGAGLAMLGVAALAMHSSSSGLAPAGGNPLLGSVLSFSGMIAVAVYFIIGKRLRRSRGTFEYTLIAYTVAALAGALICGASGLSLTGYTRTTYVYLLLLGLLPMLGGHTVINYVLKRLSLLSATIPVLGEPVGASILAYIILHEPLDKASILLMALTLTGIALTLLGEQRKG